MFYYIIILILLFLLLKNTQDKFFSVKKSTIDNRSYKVLKKCDDGSKCGGDSSVDASDRLAEINHFLLQMTEYMKNKFMKPIHIGSIEQQMTIRLLQRFDPDKVQENLVDSLDSTSYILNKEKAFFCLRDPSANEKMHDMEITKFVALHEYSHLASESYDHPFEFWRNFYILLDNAKEAGLYEPIDYSIHPTNFCGLKIEYQPYFDPMLKKI